MKILKTLKIIKIIQKINKISNTTDGKDESFTLDEVKNRYDKGKLMMVIIIY